MSFRRFLTVAAVLVLALVLVTGCGGQQSGGDSSEPSGEQGSGPIFISLATGGTAGTYFPLGGAMAEIWNDEVEGVQANAESTGASVANSRLIADGEAELALIQNDIGYYAYNGEEMFSDGALKELAGVATLYPEVIQLVARTDAGIQSVEDLAGKRVAVGASGSGTEANARQILNAFGLTYDDIEEDFLSFSEAANNMKDGHVDAAFVTSGIPTAAIQDIMATTDVVVVPIEGAPVDQLKSDYPFYTEVTIPADAYSKLTSDVNTVAVKAMLVVRADMDEELVYNLTKALFENLDRLAAAHKRGADISLESATDGMSIPLHPGVQRYYDEQGQ